jgi:parvulin-like peptidyl-prolyl isomerase
MFSFGDLESCLRDQLEVLAQKPLPELLLQQGILRTISQELLLKQLRQSVTFSPDEQPVIITRLWEGVGIDPPANLEGDWISLLPEPIQAPMEQRWDQVRLQKLMEERYRDQLEPYFLERRKDLEQVVYGLIRLKNQGAAEELYLRLIDDHVNFHELAKTHSLGEERFTHGLVGPMVISQPHPTIRAVLESLKVGEVHAPFRVDQWVLLVRMEHRQPASLNDATRIQLLQELLQQEVDESLDALLASVYPTLLAPTLLDPTPLEPTLEPEMPGSGQPPALPQAL